MQAQLGEKRNWSDSDDLCGIFKAAYTDEFYRAVRDALHAEVDAWQVITTKVDDQDSPEALWQQVHRLEPVSRNPDALRFDKNNISQEWVQQPNFVSLRHLIPVATEI